MSFHKNTRKEDLINVLKEIGEQATSKETIIELKTKFEKSAAFKDDPDFCDKSAKFVRRGQAGESRTAAARDQLTTRADQWMTPDELGKACDIFFISKNRSLHDSRNPNSFKSKNEDACNDIIIPATDEKEACKKLARVLETASRYGIELNLKKCQFLQGRLIFRACDPERKYIPSYAMIARPLSDLLRGTNPFEFGHALKVAFQNLKNALSREPVLHLFKEGAKLELHTDACKLGGSEKFRNYLLGRKFRIQTDCAAFAKTLDKKELTPKMARWSIFLTDFDYEVVHRPAKQMQHVDALSRHPVMLVTSDELTYKIVNAQESDEYIRTIKKLLQEGKTSEFIVSNKILYKISEDQELLVVPEMMQVDVIKKAHSFGHFAATKTEELGEGFLNPIPKEDLPLSTYHVDFIGPLPTTNKNYNHIFTVIDAFTKFTWLYPTKSTTAQEAIERLKLQQKTFGNPSRVISDKGGAFRSKEFEDYCADEQISNVQITTGVPRGNGQVERIHGVLIPVLTKMSIEDPTKWFKHVDSLQRVLNSVPSRSTKYSPFELLIGVKMKNPEDVMIRNLLEEESQEQLFNIEIT
ncbi:transposon Tf2-9 polyprotein [Trichonephila clavipes]|nr:transposon Tf2-9 polyprotein [Trichonephila clavipes]